MSYRTEINRYLKNPPSSWRKMFSKEGISETPTITEVIGLLGKTAGGNVSTEIQTSVENPKNMVPPKKVRDEALLGIRLSYKFNYPSYRGIGLARAIQLAVQPKIWQLSVKRMNDFFKRNARYQQLPGFGEKSNPSKSYLAWLNWGGTAGKNWAQKYY